MLNCFELDFTNKLNRSQLESAFWECEYTIVRQSWQFFCHVVIPMQSAHALSLKSDEAVIE